MIRTAPSQSHRRALLAAWTQCGDDCVLAMAVDSLGSSYRKPGAMALFDAQGGLSGSLSGGCLDAEIAEQARGCLSQRRPRRLLLDTTDDDDLLFGSQSGCRGQIEILLWPSRSAHPHPLLEALCQADALHATIELQLQLNEPGLGAGTARYSGQSQRWTGSADGDFDPGGKTVRLRLPPSPRVLLLGGGPEVPPLLRIAATLGWHSVVVEHRGRFLGSRLDQADQVIEARPGQGPPQVQLSEFDAVICMSHLYAEDLAALRLLAVSPVPWIGLLGPKLRREALLGDLGPLADALHDRLHAPVGLNLGGDGPEALAMSISAGLHQAFCWRS